MKNVILIFYLAQADILEQINKNVIQPVSKAIFGAPTLNNSTIIIRGDEVWNEKFIRRFTPPVVTIDFASINLLNIDSSQVNSITVQNVLPFINSTHVLDSILFKNISSINDKNLISSLKSAKTVKIVKSNIEFLRPDLIDQLIKLEEETPFNLILMDSWWTCDCTKKELLRRKIKGLKAYCVAPKNLVGRDFNNLKYDDLKCKKTPSIWATDIKDTEYHPTNLSCAATGYPLPRIVWESPSGRRLDRSFLEEAKSNDTLKIYSETFSLTETLIKPKVFSNSQDYFMMQSMLHVSSVDKKSAGKYKCYVYNHADVLSSDQLESNEFNRTINLDQSKSKTITLTYEPDPATNIAFFIMVGSSFCIAFVINLVNICRYYCDWTSRIKEIRFDPNRYEIPESVRTSMASVYYDKYDFTCQQAFLDALLKSGHAVKRTYENATQGIEINVSYKELTEKLRENLGNPSDWRPNLGFPTSLSRSMQGLRNRLGSFEIPSIQIPSSINVSFPSDWNIQPNWNLKVRISKFSRKWIYGCSESTEVDEYKIHNENGRVVITPMPEKKTDAPSNVPIRNRTSSSTVQLRDRTASSSNSSSAEDGFSSEGYRQQLSNLIDDQDFYVTIIATPTANQFQENCLYESNV